MSKLGRFLCVTGEVVLNDSVKRLYYYGKQSGTTENSAFAVHTGLQRRFFIDTYEKGLGSSLNLAKKKRGNRK